MKCPNCNYFDTKVVDSRLSQNGESTRRRRQCLQCNTRFTTHERMEELFPQVVKKDGRREDFVREKVLEGLRKACQKRPVTAIDTDDMVRKVEQRVQSLGVKEIESRIIGQYVMSLLRERDKVAYVRFASVYRQFEDIEEFVSGLTPEEEHPQDSPNLV